MVLVEVSDLAQTNATKGYAAGDETIRATARAVQRLAASRGGTACRYSGGRLAVVLPNLRGSEVQSAVAEFARTLDEVARTRLAAAVWRPGDSGDAVVARARRMLAHEGRPA